MIGPLSLQFSLHTAPRSSRRFCPARSSVRSKLVGEALGRSGTDASTGDDAQKQRQVDGLDEVLVVAGGDASLSIGLLTVPCQGHEIRLLAAEVCTDSRGELVTADDGHTHVDHRTEGWNRASTASASRPSCAAATSWPAPRRNVDRILSASSLSSTSMTR